MPVSTKNRVADLKLLKGELGRAKSRLQRSYHRLSSGFQVGAGHSDANLQLTEQLQARIRQFSAAERATTRAITVAKVVEEGLFEIANVVVAMHGLAEQGLQEALTAVDRAPLDVEFQSLKSEIARLGERTAMNDPSLLYSGASIDFRLHGNIDRGEQVSFEFSRGALTHFGLVRASVGGEDNSEAKASLLLLDNAADDVDKRRVDAEGRVRRLRGVLLGSRAIRNNLEAAVSSPLDVDRGEERSVLARAQVLLESGVAVLAQANQGSGLALTLLH